MKKQLAAITLLFLAGSAAAMDDVWGDNPYVSGEPALEHPIPKHTYYQRGEGDEYASQFIAQPADHVDRTTSHNLSSFSDDDPDGNSDIYGR